MKRIILLLNFLFAFCCLTSISAQEIYTLPYIYNKVKAERGLSKKTIKPIIGIISNRVNSRDNGTHTTYINAIIQAGGIPVLLPLTEDGSLIAGYLKVIDGLLLTGGGDVIPSYYKEAKDSFTADIDTLRDACELMAVVMASKRRMPILGICRGAQLINVALGGTLYQDLPSQHPSEVRHNQSAPKEEGTHLARISKTSLLHRILLQDSCMVNSFHHQAIKQLAPGLKISAMAEDGVVEGVESSPAQNIVAVQFHPECLIMKEQQPMIRIFQNLVTRSMKYRKGKR